MADETDTPPTDSTIKLTGRKLTASGGALGLKPGDILAGVDSKPFRGNVAALNKRFKAAKGRPVALTFRRDKIDVTVMAEHPNLGKWEAAPAITDWSPELQNPELLINWEILRDAQGRYDLHPLTVSELALFCPPLWLAQNRLWAICAAIIAALVVAWAIWIPLMPIFYVLAGVTLRKTGHVLYRLDRLHLGLAPYATVAAHTEAGAHAAYGKIDPNGQFYFGPPVEPVADLEEDDDQTAPETTA